MELLVVPAILQCPLHGHSRIITCTSALRLVIEVVLKFGNSISVEKCMNSQQENYQTSSVLSILTHDNFLRYWSDRYGTFFKYLGYVDGEIFAKLAWGKSPD